MTRAWSHWATSADLVALRMPVHDAGTGLEGRPLGRCARGGEFVFDPFDAYAAGLITNPNVVVAGSIGAGKSTVVKMLVDRALDRGRRCVVIDPKGEYADLARVHGVSSVSLGRGAWCDPLPENDTEALALIRAILSSALGAPLGAEEHYALDDAWESVGAPRPRRAFAALADRLRPELDGGSGPT
ncbi:MAG: helicase HerA domain-containing protein, partial [Acidimicrobiales bacterium]